MIKIGMIGCGKISDAHISAIDRIEDAKIVAVCDISEESLNTAVSKTDAVAYTDYKRMIEETQLDLVIINLPHSLHNPCTGFCAEHGVDVFLEKPMGINVEDCRQMIDVCKNNKVMLWVGHIQRYQPENIAAKQLITSGRYGKLIGIYETRNTNYFSDSRPRWFLDKKMSGGGIMMNLGAHTLDKIKYFTDSEIDTSCGHADILDGNSVESSVQAFVKTKNSVSATLNLMGCVNANRYETVLYLTEGEIRITLGDGITACGKDGVFEAVPFARENAPYLQMLDVLNALKTTKKATVDGEYGLDIMRAIEKTYR